MHRGKTFSLLRRKYKYKGMESFKETVIVNMLRDAWHKLKLFMTLVWVWVG